MADFEEDPLDLLDDGDEAIEMCLFFSEDGKDKQSGSKPPGNNSGCCMFFLVIGAPIAEAILLVSKFIV